MTFQWVDIHMDRNLWAKCGQTRYPVKSDWIPQRLPTSFPMTEDGRFQVGGFRDPEQISAQISCQCDDVTHGPDDVIVQVEAKLKFEIYNPIISQTRPSQSELRTNTI